MSYNSKEFAEFFEHGFTYVEGFMRSVRRYPNKPALYCTTHNREWTYSQLNQEVNRLVHALRACGVEQHDVVMYQLMNCAEFAFIYLASQKLGAVNSPINFRFSPGETAFIIDESKPKVFFFDARIAGTAKDALTLAKHRPEVVVVVGPQKGENHRGFLPYEEFVKDAASSEPCLPKMHMYDEVTRLFTSGTTGLPKGVPLNHVNEIMNIYDVVMHLGLSHKDVVMNLSPWFHRGGLHIFGPCPVFYVGAEGVALRAFSPGAALDWIEKLGVTFICGVPSMYRAMIEEQSFRPRDLSTLRGIVSMGAPLERELCVKLQKTFTPNVFNGYGTTETFWNTLLLPDDLPDKAGTAGRACIDDEVRVVKVCEGRLADPEELVEQDNTEVGEVIVRTTKGSLTYYNRPEELERKVNKGWFYTGDLATWDEEGYITIVSRKDDMVIMAGENVYPIQIEEVINQHEKVEDCAVIGVPDKRTGQALAAYIVRKDPYLTAKELRHYLRDHPMISTHKIPKYFAFVESLPMTATGKKQHYVLRREAPKDMENGVLKRM